MSASAVPNREPQLDFTWGFKAFTLLGGLLLQIDSSFAWFLAHFYSQQFFMDEIIREDGVGLFVEGGPGFGTEGEWLWHK